MYQKTLFCKVICNFAWIYFFVLGIYFRKARCCLNEGVLLNLILDIVVPKISKSQDVNPNLLPALNTEVEQAILCLYGHPKKQAERTKKKLKVVHPDTSQLMISQHSILSSKVFVFKKFFHAQCFITPFSPS